MTFASSGDLLIANHGAGLQAVSPEGEVAVLADEADGTPILFANDVDISSDGIVYFTDSSTRYNTTTLGNDSASYLLPDLIDGRATGRVLAHDLRTGETRVLLDRLYFPNGVALTDDGRRIWSPSRTATASWNTRSTALAPASSPTTCPAPPTTSTATSTDRCSSPSTTGRTSWTPSSFRTRSPARS
jgi:sugar lactone lactonase YvrE